MQGSKSITIVFCIRVTVYSDAWLYYLNFILYGFKVYVIRLENKWRAYFTQITPAERGIYKKYLSVIFFCVVLQMSSTIVTIFI